MEVVGITTLLLRQLALFAVTGYFMVFVYNFFFKWVLEKKQNQEKELPGPFPWPLIGNCVTIGKFKNPWLAFSHLKKQYGGVFAVHIGSHKCLVVNSYDLMRELLVDKAADFANRPDFPRFHAIFLDNRELSLALCDWSEKHKMRRDLIFPYTHPRKGDMKNEILYESATTQVGKMLDELKMLNGQDVEVAKHIRLTWFTIFFQYFYGITIDTSDETLREVVDVYEYVVEDLFNGYASDFFTWFAKFDRHLYFLRKVIRPAVNFTVNMFQQRKTLLQNGNKRNPNNLIDIILTSTGNNNKPLVTEADGRSALDDLVGGAAAMAPVFVWALLYAARDERIKSRIREEVRLATDDNSRPPSLAERHHLVYTEATILETLRVVSSPIVPHCTVKPTSISGYAVESNCVTFLNVLAVNMDPQLWKDPYTFAPERFIKDGAVRKPDYFIPFGIGRRSCLGDGIAKPLMAHTLALILQKMDVVVPEGGYCPEIPDMMGQVIPDKPIMLKFIPLECSSNDAAFD